MLDPVTSCNEPRHFKATILHFLELGIPAVAWPNETSQGPCGFTVRAGFWAR